MAVLTYTVKITKFITLFPSRDVPEVYGAGRVAYHLARGLADSGHEIHVFTPSSRNSVEKYGNLTVHLYRSIIKYRSCRHISQVVSRASQV
ncbi:MAG: glycosyltransferase [Pyrobaculum sp.]